ncbi:MAG: FAD-dependent oxidoreductase [Saprospiraceae bacterium]|nr:FAD-dependent oxidoreductase [Saprospiraceae bacterium]MBP6568707.1 FAD-dependent oxidoreductase [Saprospiraceae bacterium]
MARIIIIGNGIAGSTAARYIRKNSDHEITMISGETDYPFSRTALMYIYMGHMKFEHTKLYEDWFWAKNRIKTIKAWVKEIDTISKSILLDNGEIISYDKLILATGSKSNKFGWPGQDLKGVQGLYHLQDLENMENATQQGLTRAVIVGGGLIGIEMAEMFHSRHIPVTFLVREDSFWNAVLPAEESEMINKHILDNGIDLRLNEELQEIKGLDGNVSSIVCKNSGEEIDCEFVGLTVGVSPNIDFIKSSGIAINRGIVVDEYLGTSAKDVYALGDCVELSKPNPGRRPIEAVWYTGRMMGKTLAQTICDQPTKYDPGIWFNSAKFFEIEYQVYGDIPAKTPENITSLYWQHPSENKAIRINYETASGAVTGFNLMGIRYRHAVCEKWIADKTKIETVIENLSLANFDPEFFEEYESAFMDTYNQKSGKALKLKSKRKLSMVEQFLFGY